MKVTKLTNGLYEIKHKNNLYRIENMIDYNRYWVIRNSDSNWIDSQYTKKECLEWLKLYK